MTSTGRNPRIGIALKISSVLGFTLMAACVKSAAAVVPIGQVCFFRAFVALLTIMVFQVWRREFPAALYTANPLGHLWRGLLGLAAMSLNFMAIAYLPLPDAIALGYAMPLLLTILAAAMLGEPIRAVRLGAVMVGLAGVVIVMWPRLAFLKGESGHPGETIGALCALVGAFVVALGAVVVTRLIAAERTSTVVFYFSAISSVGFLLTAPFGWRWPDGGTLALLIASGLLGGVSQLLVTQSYRHADTSAVAPFEYVSILFGIALGFFVFGEIPTLAMLAGSAIVIGAGLVVIWREHGGRRPPVAMPHPWPWAMIGVEDHEGG